MTTETKTPTDEQLENFREHVLTALKKIPGARWYALDQTQVDALAHLGICWQKERAERDIKFDASEFRMLMAENVKRIASLRQTWPPGESTPLSEVWRNPLTNEPLGLPTTLDEQAALARHEQALLDLLKELEARPYQTIAKLRDAEAARARLAAISYGETEHKGNVFVNGDLRTQTEFVQRHRDDPDLIAVYRAEMKRAEVPWAPGSFNLTGIGALGPEISKLAHKAREMQEAQITAQVAAAKVAEAAAVEKRRRAEALLAK